MAILSPSEMPVVLKIASDPLKAYVFDKLGYPQVEVELSERQLENAIRTVGDFIAGYFPREQKLYYFYTQPLVCTYDFPPDAYWIQEVNWTAQSTNIGDVFSAETFLFNIGQISGVNNLLLEYHMLQAYRKNSAKIMNSEGHWEVINEGDGDATKQKIRLYPTPKGSFPVIVLYYPVVTHWRSPQAKLLASDMLLAESKIMLGNARRKLAGIPLPDGSSLALDGEALVSEGTEERNAIVDKAIMLGEQLPVVVL